MVARLSRRGFIRLGAAGTLGLATGCGTILHPERRNQPPGGSIDWGIFALDTVGLLLFFFPGVIAFAVDFTTGAIYFPPSGGYGAAKPTAETEPLVKVQVPRNELSQQRLEEVATQHAGRDVRLRAGEYATAPLTKLADFWPTHKRLAAERS